jgi:hypothetical protein
MRTPAQLQLFSELLETVTTPDGACDETDGSWSIYSIPPPGVGWRISNFSRERRTTWMRRIPVVWRPVRGGHRWVRR